LSSLLLTPVALRALLAQAAAASFALAAAALGAAAPALLLALGAGALAAVLSRALRLPAWWLPIQFAFAPMVVLAFALRIDPLWYLGAFVALALVFGAVHASRVPLFLSSDAALAQLIAQLPEDRALAFFDIGCGPGGVLAAVSRARRQVRCTGIEAAPLPWAVAALRGAMGRPGFEVRFGSFWNRHLGQADVVFAYLSPVAMGRLWTKAKHEMREGAILISNSFPIPDVAATQHLQWGPAREAALFVYRM